MKLVRSHAWVRLEAIKDNNFRCIVVLTVEEPTTRIAGNQTWPEKEWLLASCQMSLRLGI